MNLGALFVDLIGQILANPIVVTGAMVVGGALVAGWLLATVWAFHDVAHRSDSILARYGAAAFVLLSGPLLLPLSLTIVGVLRPLETPADRRVQRLVQTLRSRDANSASCVDCGARLEAAWMRCPWCAAWQGRQCPRCERLAPIGADICPWCTWAPGDASDRTSVPVPVGADHRVAAGVAAMRRGDDEMNEAPGLDWGSMVLPPVGAVGEPGAAARTA